MYIRYHFVYHGDEYNNDTVFSRPAVGSAAAPPRGRRSPERLRRESPARRDERQPDVRVARRQGGGHADVDARRAAAGARRRRRRRRRRWRPDGDRRLRGRHPAGQAGEREELPDAAAEEDG